MTYLIKHPFILSSALLWLGFILAISFMEAWIKFRAPGVTLPIGLSIGRLVFNALNKVEWLFTLIILLNLALHFNNFKSYQTLIISSLTLILVIQTFWLLPQLDARAELYIQGKEVSASNLHFYYIIGEVLKLPLLLTLMLTLLKKTL